MPKYWLLSRCDNEVSVAWQCCFGSVATLFFLTSPLRHPILSDAKIQNIVYQQILKSHYYYYKGWQIISETGCLSAYRWCRWCRWCPRGGSWCSRWWLVVSGHIYTADHPDGHTQGSSARRAVSLLNWSFKVGLTNAIAIIINYLGVPFRICFTKQERVKK